MALDKVGFEVDVDLGSFRTQLRTAQQEAIALVDKFGQFSPEAAEAAKRVAELRDRMQDTQSLIRAFNPDQKFAAFSQALRSVTGGFAALQGGMALFGKQTEEVQAQLLKVQSALALSEGLNNFLDDGIQGFKNFGSVIKNQVVTAFSTLRGAIIATGLGALAVGVGVIVANWEKFTKIIRESIPGLEGVGKRFDEIKVVLAGVGNVIFQYVITPIKVFIDLVNGDFKKAFDNIKNGLDVVGNFQEGVQEKRLKLAADSAKESLAITVKATEKEIELMKARGEDTFKIERANLELKKKLLDEEPEKVEEINQEIRILDASHKKKLADQQKTANDKRAQEQKAANEKALEEEVRNAEAAVDAIEKINQERELINKAPREKELIELQRWYDAQKAIILKGGGDLAALESLFASRRGIISLKYFEAELEKQQAANEKKAQAEQTAQELEVNRKAAQVNTLLTAIADYGTRETVSVTDRLAVLDQLEQVALNDVTLTEQQKTEILRANSAARVQIATQESQAKEALLQNELTIINAAAQIAGQQTAAGKALAVAATVISTYSAAQKAYASQIIPGDPTSIFRATIAAAASVAQGLVRVKSILAVKIPGQADKGQAGITPQPIGLGGLGRSVSNPTQELLAENINRENAPARVFVVESDITNTQNRTNRLTRASVLGG